MIDRELYLPESWTDDRRAAAPRGSPTTWSFGPSRSLPSLLERALDAGVPAAWVTADEVYGGSPALRGWLEDRRVACAGGQCTELLAVQAPDGPAGRVPCRGAGRRGAGRAVGRLQRWPWRQGSPAV